MPGDLGGLLIPGALDHPVMPPVGNPCNFWDAAAHGLHVSCQMGENSTDLGYYGDYLQGDFTDPYGWAYRVTIGENNDVEIALYNPAGGFLAPGNPYDFPPARTWAFEGQCADNILTGTDNVTGRFFSMQLTVEPPAEPLHPNL